MNKKVWNKWIGNEKKRFILEKFKHMIPLENVDKSCKDIVIHHEFLQDRFFFLFYISNARDIQCENLRN